MIKLKEKGFTLVEIMIVVAIIAILSAIAIPNFMTARSKSRANACKANLRQIDAAVEMFAMDTLLTDGNTVAMASLIPTYIKKAPTCQSAGTYGASEAWCTGASLVFTGGFAAEFFVVGNTPWCSIGSAIGAGGFPHILYQ